MGPLSRDYKNGGRRLESVGGSRLNVGALAHDKCREGTRCTGPGCTLRTGKTARRKRRQRGFTLEELQDAITEGI